MTHKPRRGLAPQLEALMGRGEKSYVTLYTCAEEHLVSFKKLHPGIKTGKGCINFRDKDPIPLEDLKSVIHSAITGSQEHR